MFHPSNFIRFLLFASTVVLLGCFDTVRVVNGGSPVLSTGDHVDDVIDKYIQDHDVMVFAKSYCPHCKTSKSIVELLQQETSHYATWTEKFLYLDQMEDPNDGTMIQNALYEKTEQRTVPNIFVGGKHIGGNTDLVALYQSGELIITIKEIAMSRVRTEL
jgi:glutaredoxin 3